MNRLGVAILYPEHLGLNQARVLQVAATARALAREGAAVHLVAGRFWGLGRRLEELGLGGLEGFKLEPVLMARSGPGLPLPFTWGRLYNICALRVLARLHRQGVKVALVRHLKLADYLLANQNAHGMTVVYEAHERFAQVAREAGMAADKLQGLEALERRVLAAADRVVAISRPLADDLTPLVKSGQPVAVSPSGVSGRFFLPLGLPRQTNLAAYAGGLMAWKGVDLLLEALALAPKVRLETLGGQGRSTSWRRLMALAARLELGPRLKMRPRAGQDAVLELLGRASLAVWPGSGKDSIGARYTSPLKLFEYLAAGCAVLAPDLPAARAVLKDGENAVLFKPDDPASLAEAMARLVADPERARALGGAGQALARKYTWRARAKTLIPLLARAAAERTP